MPLLSSEPLRDNRDLSSELKSLLSRKDSEESKGIEFKPELWDPHLDADVNLEIYNQYAADLYGILVLLTGGEAKSLLRGMIDSGMSLDGYKALLLLEKRFDARTSASLLSTYLEVVIPQRLKTSDLITGIHYWDP